MTNDGISAMLVATDATNNQTGGLQEARQGFSGSVPPMFGHKLRRHKQRFGKIATTVVLDKDEFFYNDNNNNNNNNNKKISLVHS